MYDAYLQGLSIALAPQNLLLCFVGVVYGTVIGVLPGIGSVAGIAMLLPLTYGLPPTGALIMLAGIYYGTEYGGSTTSILLRTPGEGGSAVTCLDGYAMARKGKAKLALATAAIGSFVAGTLAAVALMLLTEPLATLAVKLGPPEYFAVALLALLLTASLAHRSPVKGLASLILGLLLATIGLDAQSGSSRFDLGSPALMDGIPFIIAASGLFAISEVMFQLNRGRDKQKRLEIAGGRWIGWQDLKRILPPALRGSSMGFFIGTMPGMGSIAATFLSYNVERSLSKRPEEFGKGALAGVAGPESANNASAQGSMLPLMTLGIPGSATTAVMLGAFMMYGLQPGPLLMQSDPGLVFAIIASMYVGNAMLLVLNLPLVPLFAKLLDLPAAILNGLVIVFVVTSIYSIRGEFLDIGLLAGFGILGYLMRRADFPVAPILMGLVLGDILESSMRRSLALSLGDPMIFLNRPVSAALITVAVLFFLFRLWRMQTSGSRTLPQTDAPGA
jgi:putative tricarboxylic transport membrane protein